MIISEAVNKLVFEMIQLTGHFEDQDIYKRYIQMAIMVGVEHFSNDMDEIIALDMNGKETGRFKSLKEAQDKLDIKQYDISKVLSGKRHSVKGLIFIRSKDWKH